MKIRYAGLAALAGSMLLCFGLPAFAQDEVSVTFTGGYTTTWGNDSGDYGAGIYSANINGSPSASGIICDDFNDEVTSGETWNANAYQVSTLVSSGNLDSTLFGSSIGVQGYAEVATLVSLMFSGGTSLGGYSGITQAEISSAIWYITTPGGIGGLNSTAMNLVNYVIGLFGGSGATASQIAAATNYLNSLTNLWILTPDPKTGVGSGEAQEMWTENLSVPEGGAAILYLLLAGFTCFGVIFRNARKQALKRIVA